MKAILIPVTGDPAYVEHNGLDDLQRLVGGLIQAVYPPTREDAVAFINEEGKFSLPPNDTATALLRDALFPGDWIAGPCVLVGCDHSDGTDKPVPDDFLPIVQEVADALPV